MSCRVHVLLMDAKGVGSWWDAGGGGGGAMVAVMYPAALLRGVVNERGNVHTLEWS